jgi:cation diffusion facilitator family transporter
MAESKTAVYAAIGGNLAIAVTKFMGATVTGSSAMLSEGIHSLVDTGNGALLLLGLKRSKLPPDDDHPFGHGKELYFWSLIVAVLIFGLGGGVSAYEGILHMLDPNPLEDPKWNYVVLAFAMVFEGVSFAFALRAFLKEKRDEPFWDALRSSKDPTTYTVLAEDSAALLGLMAAFAGVYASHRLEMPVLDGAASVVIGILLAGVAALLIRESRGLLVGEGVRHETADSIRATVRRYDGVTAAARPVTMYLGPEDVLLVLDVQFASELSAAEVTSTIARMEKEIRERYSRIKRIYIEAAAVGSAGERSTVA